MLEQVSHEGQLHGLTGHQLLLLLRDDDGHGHQLLLLLRDDDGHEHLLLILLLLLLRDDDGHDLGQLLRDMHRRKDGGHLLLLDRHRLIQVHLHPTDRQVECYEIQPSGYSNQATTIYYCHCINSQDTNTLHMQHSMYMQHSLPAGLQPVP